ncbi:hypothetical protein NUW54_g13918 [Trametes sanguinea]|uniref:Uncharacterized protein n=1 Tax=Trametes sanguinea TaxID=158606 RepID=A0ACC1MGX8_9APHY|nr:hypothetical protein NUW54_g13918 [Trametes sanguinea]
MARWCPLLVRDAAGAAFALSWAGLARSHGCAEETSTHRLQPQQTIGSRSGAGLGSGCVQMLDGGAPGKDRALDRCIWACIDDDINHRRASEEEISRDFSRDRERVAVVSDAGTTVGIPSEPRDRRPSGAYPPPPKVEDEKEEGEISLARASLLASSHTYRAGTSFEC